MRLGGWSPCTGNPSDLSTEIHVGIHHDRHGHHIIDVRSVGWQELQHGVDQVTQLLGVARVDRLKYRRGLHDLQHQSWEILGPGERERKR